MTGTTAPEPEPYTPTKLDIARGTLSDFAAGVLDVGDENRHREHVIYVLNALDRLVQKHDVLHRAAVEALWAVEKVQLSGKGSDIVALGARLEDLNDQIRPSQ